MRRANGLNEFYSRMKGNEGMELFVDKEGNPTIDYPHVHIIHTGNNTVEIVASKSRGNHIWRKVLIDPSGSDVEKAVAEARSHL